MSARTQKHGRSAVSRMLSAASWAPPAGSWLLLTAAMLWPAFVLITRCLREGAPAPDGFVFSARQLELLTRTLWLSAVATIICLVLSLPGAFVIGRAGRVGRRPIFVALFATLLLTPPMVNVFGWERALDALRGDAPFPPWLTGEARCVVVWALWAWPISSLLLGAGWSSVGHRAYEAALMVASPARAFLLAVLPLLSRHLGLGALILFVLFMSDYGVPHACGLQVYATELLSWASSSTRAIDTLWPALPSIGLIAAGLTGVLLFWRRSAVDPGEPTGFPAPRPGSSRIAEALTLGCFALSWVVPLGVLAVQRASVQAFVRALEVYGTDLAWSLATSVAAGVLAVGMGLGLATSGVGRSVGLAAAIAFGALPGALIGVALVMGYNSSRLWWIYDNGSIVVLSYLARFGWVGVLTAVAIRADAPRELTDQARADGAGAGAVLARVLIPTNWPVLFGAVGVVAALCMADVAASSLVRVPSYNPIAHVLIEKFHRLEDEMLLAISFWLVLASMPAVLLFWVAARRRAEA